MATAYISTSTELTLLNTLTRPGVIILPSTTSVPGRILTFKDTRGSFGVSSITFSTAASFEFLENNTRAITYNDPFGAYSFIAGTDNKWYTIGGSRMFSATISSITTLSLNSFNISSANITTSTLQFRDTATASTNTLFSLSTNVFMSSPTNFFILGPTKAPKPLFVPVRRGFVPTQIAGSILWLDAADPSAFTGGNVWLDKSGTQNNGINTTIAGNSMPTLGLWPNGLQAATFTRTANTTGTSMMTTSTANPANSYTLYIAMRITGLAPTSDPNGTEQFIFINHIEGARQLKTTTSATAGFPANLVFNFTNLAGAVTLTTNVQLGQGFLVGYVPSLTTGTAYFNSGTTATQTTVASGISRWYFGSANNSANRYLTGQIGEILAYNSVLIQSNREQVEGYLAWKWGLVGSLPSNHPFKNSPP